MKQKKFIIGGAILIVAIVALVIIIMNASLDHYQTISDLKAQTPDIYGEKVRVRGTIQQGSVQHQEGKILFTIYDEENEEQRLDVVYDGTESPGSMDSQSKVEVTAEGTLGSEEGRDVFRASKLLISCPSKVQAAQQ